VTQTDVKRMLAYSSVTHAGFLLTGLLSADAAGIAATLFYLAVYGLSTVGAFAVVTLVREDTDEEATGLARWAGLGRRSPWTATVFALLLLSFAGLPLTSGFIAKFAVFNAAAAGYGASVVVVGVLTSAVAAFFYVRVIVMMFFTDPPADAPDVRSPALTWALILLTGIGTLVFGLFPQPLLDLAEQAATFVG